MAYYMQNSSYLNTHIWTFLLQSFLKQTFTLHKQYRNNFIQILTYYQQDKNRYTRTLAKFYNLIMLWHSQPLFQCFLTCARLNPRGSVNQNKGFDRGPDRHSLWCIDLQPIFSELYFCICVNFLFCCGNICSSFNTAIFCAWFNLLNVDYLLMFCIPKSHIFPPLWRFRWIQVQNFRGSVPPTKLQNTALFSITSYH